jgi:hypothetical protein
MNTNIERSAARRGHGTGALAMGFIVGIVLPSLSPRTKTPEAFNAINFANGWDIDREPNSARSE